MTRHEKNLEWLYKRIPDDENWEEDLEAREDLATTLINYEALKDFFITNHISDYALIDIVNRIHQFCLNGECPSCPFNQARHEVRVEELDDFCQIHKVTQLLNQVPATWNMEKLEKIIKED